MLMLRDVDRSVETNRGSDLMSVLEASMKEEPWRKDEIASAEEAYNFLANVGRIGGTFVVSAYMKVSACEFGGSGTDLPGMGPSS